jgi:hypothetical protein
MLNTHSAQQCYLVNLAVLSYMYVYCFFKWHWHTCVPHDEHCCLDNDVFPLLCFCALRLQFLILNTWHLNMNIFIILILFIIIKKLTEINSSVYWKLQQQQLKSVYSNDDNYENDAYTIYACCFETSLVVCSTTKAGSQSDGMVREKWKRSYAINSRKLY